jgi:hypothetical protein
MSLRAIALFALLRDVLRTPHGTVWTDYRGERANLPRTAAIEARKLEVSYPVPPMRRAGP